MKAFTAVALREIREKWFVLATAGLAALIPFAVPLARALTGPTARDARELIALLLASCIAVSVAIGLGASVFTGDLASRRMSFYFSRPVSVLGLWAGKLAAAAVLVGGAFALILGPTCVAERKLILPPSDEGPAVLIAAAALALLVLASNAIATIVRSRSSIALADWAASVGVALILVWTLSILRRHGFVPPLTWIWPVAGLVIASLAFASFRSLARGRTDLRQAHAALSGSLWAVLVPAAIGCLAYSSWAVHSPPSALSRVSANPIASDGWLEVAGPARGLNAEFLYDARTGRYERLPSPFVEMVSTADGRVALWLESEADHGPWTLHTRRLDVLDAPDVETKIVLRGRAWPLLVSPDGARIAAVSGRLLSVYDVASGRNLVSVQIGDGDETISGAFVSPSLVRIFRISEAASAGRVRAEALELDVAARTLQKTGAADDLLRSSPLLVNPYREEIVMNEAHGTRITIRDPRTLEIRAVLKEGGFMRSAMTAFRSDGSVVLGLSDEHSAWIETFTPEGISRGRIPLGTPGWVFLGGEPARGALLAGVRSFSLSEDPAAGGATVLHLVDLDNATQKTVADRLQPLHGWWHPRRIAPGSEATKLFLSDDGALVRFDPATGARRTLLGPDGSH